MLRRGQAADISAGGILIHTTQPELAGRHLDLELHPEEGVEAGDVIMVKGEVARVDPLGGGEYAMGVRFLQKVPATENTGARMRPATEKESKKLAGAIQRQLDAMQPAARLEVSGAAKKAAATSAAKKTSPAKAKSVKPRRSWRTFAMLLLLLLLLPPVLAVLFLGGKWGLERFRSTSPRPVPARPTETPPPQSSRETTLNRLDQRLAQIESDAPAYYLNRGSYLLTQGKHVAAAQAFKAAQKAPKLTPVERFVAQLGEAQALASDGRTDEAIAILEVPFAELDAVSEPWHALKATFLEGLYNQPESPASRMPLVNAFTFRAHTPVDGQGGPAPEGDLQLEVDTNRHLLTVLENNTIKAVYPVGLGLDGQTPLGLFSITNKIENPDWYNRGSVVKAGDPANQLGSRWLGLSDEKGPTPLGIHGTEDDNSIGSNLSRGCIRMRPADVEELFSLVDVGTPVRIRAL